MKIQDCQAPKNLSFLFVLAKVLLFSFHVSSAADSISRFQQLSEGKTLVSENGGFEMGFFSPGSSANRYLGIWYKRIPMRTVVWVANRANPVKDNSSMLHINNKGNLELVNQNGTVFWSTNSTKKALNPIAQLLDSGNLVLRDERDQVAKNYLWQSFDYPSDTFLPGMKVGWDLKTGLERRISAWKNWDDPSPGDFSWGISLEGVPQGMFLKGSKVYYRVGPWNGIRFSGTPEMKISGLFEFEFISNEDEVYFIYNLTDKSLLSRVVMNQTSANRHGYIWNDATKSWDDYSSAPRDNCDYYNLCGPNANCIVGDSPVCQCLTGFKPRSQESWDRKDWTQGCSLSEQLSCKDKNKDGFSKVSALKYPDTSHSWANESMNLNQCRDNCLENCSCTAYAKSDVREGSGCLMWFGDLKGIREFPDGGEDVHIRMKISDTAPKEGRKKKVAVTVIIVVSVLVVILVLCYIGKRIINFRAEKNLMEKTNGQKEDLELPIFDLATIVKATDDFSISNKLGKGGFGTVYMGTLSDGQDIAVKRLSQSSEQGLTEFMNEVSLIAKLQHRNLVKLLGCCIQGEEKMLVYEYMPNKSLDSFIFDHVKGRVLDWSKRLNIICGVARGLLYFHQDSRLRIIHRDLKVSNVLLDNELNPKISDFGMAKSFGGDQIEGNTNRVVGTYGYMSPEYAIHGLFSIKSDIFSFGVLLLEIVSGKKNRVVSHSSNSTNLIGHAWILWKESRPLDLIDSCMENSCVPPEALRCIHIGLLCVQQHPEDRPSMSNVVLMLGSESALPQPKEPAFLTESYLPEAVSSNNQQSFSTNEMSFTVLEPR